MWCVLATLFFFFNDTATTEIYTLSLHDALPICRRVGRRAVVGAHVHPGGRLGHAVALEQPHSAIQPGAGHPFLHRRPARSEEHTSELQSRQYLVCRLLLEKKKKSTGVPYISLYN